eukprot:TRINITY_DN6038_c0_g2_i1.p1 TRINITY_DN6038_c0_g2~~TRINITY_DN6038_c0_g2_i1.p1  ORF type:complete len:145 (-),score=38.28 TRINITY_DN6038_c0_g2_i1:407-841(-)
MARRGSLLTSVLLLDVMMLGCWYLSGAFVSAPAQRNALDGAGLLASSAAAAAMLPSAAQAVEKWQYQEPSGDLTPEQIFIFLFFFLIHAAGVADFYAKKTGAGPAVPLNPFRSSQFSVAFDAYEPTFYKKKGDGNPAGPAGLGL